MIRRLLLAAMLCMGAAAVLAQSAPGVVALDGEDKYVLSKSFLYLEDKESKLTFDDVSKPEVQQMFQPVRHEGPGDNFGLTSSAIWLKVTLRAAPKAREDWLFNVA